MPLAENPPRGQFCLVLGAGGATSVVYICGALRALREVAGIDARQARVIVGTSAGAIVGSDLRLGRSDDEIMGELTAGLPGDGSRDIVPAWRSVPELARRLVGSMWIMSRSSPSGELVTIGLNRGRARSSPAR